jgi:twitching motility protein PilT
VRHFTRNARDMAPLQRERAFETLRDLGERVLPGLIELMDDPDSEVRNLAITMASTVGEHPRMVKPLVRALKEPDWWIRATAVETLGQIGTADVIQPLITQLSDEDAVWTAIGSLVNTARARKRDGDKDSYQAALAPLLKLLKDGQQGKGKLDDEEASEIRVEILHALMQQPEEHLIEVFKQVAQGDVHPRVRDEALAAATALARQTGVRLEEEELREKATSTAGLTPLQKMLAEARKRGASDLHISALQPIMIRRNAELEHFNDDGSLTAEESARILREILEDDQAAAIARDGQVSFCCTVPGHGRFRASVFADYRGVNAVFRIIPREMPTIQSIGLPGHFSQVQYWHQGLLLVCGASGSGKTTTLAALINLINETRESHVLTIEDPIEYVHSSRRSLINQRGLKVHTGSYHRALRGALREDPDVIVIGELSDTETVALALEASETGHLVIGTLNCTTAISGIERVVNSFSQDEQNQVRLALSESLKAIIAQNLSPTTSGGMTAIFEILMGTDTIRNLIRENKTLMMESVMQTGRGQGMQTADDALMELVRAGVISPEHAARRARNQNTLDELTNAN